MAQFLDKSGLNTVLTPIKKAINQVSKPFNLIFNTFAVNQQSTKTNKEYTDLTLTGKEYNIIVGNANGRYFPIEMTNSSSTSGLDIIKIKYPLGKITEIHLKDLKTNPNDKVTISSVTTYQDFYIGNSPTVVLSPEGFSNNPVNDGRTIDIFNNLPLEYKGKKIFQLQWSADGTTWNDQTVTNEQWTYITRRKQLADNIRFGNGSQVRITIDCSSTDYKFYAQLTAVYIGFNTEGTICDFVVEQNPDNSDTWNTIWDSRKSNYALEGSSRTDRGLATWPGQLVFLPKYGSNRIGGFGVAKQRYTFIPRDNGHIIISTLSMLANNLYSTTYPIEITDKPLYTVPTASPSEYGLVKVNISDVDSTDINLNESVYTGKSHLDNTGILGTDIPISIYTKLADGIGGQLPAQTLFTQSGIMNNSMVEMYPIAIVYIKWTNGVGTLNVKDVVDTTYAEQTLESDSASVDFSTLARLTNIRDEIEVSISKNDVIYETAFNSTTKQLTFSYLDNSKNYTMIVKLYMK